jgi:uncharacterized protein (DUF2141 family)
MFRKNINSRVGCLALRVVLAPSGLRACTLFRKKLAPVLLLVAFVNLALPANSSVRARFAPVQLYSTSDASGAASVVYQDLNGDGKIDLVTANNDGSVSVLLGNGDGKFRAAVVYGSGGSGATSVAIADVNRDGKLDVLVSNNCEPSGGNCANGSVGVLLGNGDGTFQPVVTYASGGFFASALAVGDLNGDGKPDVVVTNGFSTATVGVLLGNGDGTFQPVVLYDSGSQSAKSVAIADLNGDGKPDVVVTNCSFDNGALCAHDKDSNSVAVLLGNGDGTLQSAVTYPTGGASPYAVKVEDVNGDGKLDLVVANNCSSPGPFNCAPGAVGILLGNGDGTFRLAVSYSSGGRNAVSIAVADVNGDGNLDIAVSNQGNSTLGVLLGNGDGTFRKASVYSVLGGALSIADLNGDGRPDVVLATPETNSLSIGVLLNLTLAATTSTVTTSGSPSHINQPVTFTATIGSSNGQIPDGQTITFYNGKTIIGTATTASGVAVFTTSSLTAGTHTIKASYPGHAFFKASSGTVKQVVTP